MATGLDTELGLISKLVEDVAPENSPLESQLNRLSGQLIKLALAIVAILGVLGLLQGGNDVLIIKASIALAVAAIPEGLPIVATMALARGMWRMAKHNALVEHLSAVETLGATTVILTDKTGTLMGTVHRADDDFVMWVKGAPEEVLEACSTSVQTDGVNASLTPEKRAFWKSRTDQMAARGMRVLAVATRTLQSPQAATYADLKFLGLVGLIDPPRRDVPQAITQCRSAGIRVITQ